MKSKDKPHEIRSQGELKNLSRTPSSLAMKRLITLSVIALISVGGGCSSWASGGSSGSTPVWMVLLGLVVLLVVIGCFFQLVMLAFQESPLWGFAALFLPFGIPIFVFTHWHNAKKPFIIILLLIPVCLTVMLLPALSSARGYARAAALVCRMNFEKIQGGMSSSDVEKILGQPGKIESSDPKYKIRPDYTLLDGQIWRVSNPYYGNGPTWKADNSSENRTIFKGERGIPADPQFSFYIATWGSQKQRTIMVAFINGCVHQWAYRGPVEDFKTAEAPLQPTL